MRAIPVVLLGTVGMMGMGQTTGPATAPAKVYEVHFFHSAHIGDRMKVHLHEHMRQSTTVAGAGVAQSEEQDILLDGVLETTAVDDLGRETGFHITVEQLKATRNGVEEETVAKNAEVNAKVGDTVEFTMKDAPMPQTAKEALGELFTPIPKADRTTDDESLNGGGRRRVGEVFAVNAKAIVGVWHLAGLKANAEDLQGQSTIQDAKVLNGQSALQIATVVSCGQVVPASDRGAKNGSIVQTATGLFPTAKESRDAELTMTLEVHIARTADDQEQTIDIERKHEETRSTIN